MNGLVYREGLYFIKYISNTNNKKVEDDDLRVGVLSSQKPIK